MVERNQKSSIIKNAFLKVILNIFNVIIPIITGPYLARTLDVDLYGIYNKSLAFVGFLLPFAGFGIYNYGIREISQVKKDDKRLTKIFSVLFGIGAISTICVLLFYFIYLGMAKDIDHKVLYYVMSIQIIASMFNVEYMNEAFENYSFIVYKSLAVRILNVILILLCVRKPNDILVYAVIYSGLQFLNYFLSFVYVKLKVKFTKVSFAEFKHVMKPLVIMFMLMNCNMLYTSLDKLFMSFVSDGIYVTYYTFSQTIINLVTSVLNSIVLVTIPRLSAYIGNGQKKEYALLINKSSNIFLMFTVPLCFGFCIFSNIIMFIYGGSNYTGAGNTFAFFSLRMLIWALDYVLANQILFVQGYEAKITKLYFICGGLNIAIKIVLAMTGMLTSETAIVTTALAEMVLIVFEVLTIKKYKLIGIENLRNKYIKYVLLGILFIPVGVINYNLLKVTYVLNIKFLFYIVITFFECAAIYFAGLLFTKDEAFLECVSVIKKRFKIE